MKVYIMTNGRTTRVFTTKEKLLEGYLKECKSYYNNYENSVKEAVWDLNRNYPGMSEEHRQDLLNFIQEKPYKGIFTLDELGDTDTSFTFTITKLDE